MALAYDWRVNSDCPEYRPGLRLGGLVRSLDRFGTKRSSFVSASERIAYMYEKPGAVITVWVKSPPIRLMSDFTNLIDANIHDCIRSQTYGQR